ncbi:T-cell surface glycoprotein CD3 epsilon chain [Sturnira hondurensis]|uniref:T-cell surface glycoprotein CD3 epsilon chain n=1 Tax=Sturnira hondurensis TaxID=192404 RepID=UPI001879C4D8|nr:T-cell surface glycoprotein CD3 epsilon chain [Sturnira hondurensis]XP_036913376.1 T-cell surface glycoprotein CD3 epsilon chain [Sturnira hondurensis]
MQLGNLWRVLGLCLLSVGAWGQEENEDNEYQVSISGTKVELTCPKNVGSEVKWKHNDKLKAQQEVNLVLEDFSEMKDSGYYFCYSESTSEKYNNYLYLKAKVCENCIEVDLAAVAAIIIVDICITLGLLLLVYYWSKNRKAKAKPVTRGVGAGSRPGGQNKERPPPVPNPDYEPIRKGQRDLYSGLNQRGT